jgi:hypothetical protein
MENANANIAHTTDILAARMIEGATLLGEYAKKIDEARASTEGSQWRNAPKGEGSREFFNLARNLHRLGHDAASIRDRLTSEVIYARHPDERRREISGVVAKVTKGGDHPAASNDHGADQGLRRKG